MKDTNKWQQRREAMGKDPIWRLILRFSGPAIISMTVASSYNLVDSIFIGRLGPTALAAMTVTFPVILSFIAITSGTAVGVTSLISRSLGAGNEENANRTAGIAITLAFIISAVIAAVCLPIIDDILRTLGANNEVLPLARSYLSVMTVFYIFSYLAMMCASIVRADGNPVFSSSVSISTALLNIALDPVFIFGLGPIPAMGIQGAAIATVIAQATGTAVFAYHIIFGKTGYKFQLNYFIPSLKIIKDIYRVGMASIIRSASQLVVIGVVNTTAASFGVIPLAIIGVLTRAGRFVQMPVLGLGQGTLPIIGYNYGAKNKPRVAELVFKMMLSGSVWTFIIWLAIMLFPTNVMSIFSGDAEFLIEGTQAIRIYYLVAFTLGIRMIPGFFFQGIGRGLPSTMIMLSQNIIFLLIPVIVLPRYFGLNGLWTAFPLSNILGLLLGLIWMIIELRRKEINLFWWKYKTEISNNQESI